tara:strand:- start:4933 stop:7836 length:2904 start_codon:yes stop_codon:yes gene_type:complete
MAFLGLPRGLMAGFVPRWQVIQDEKKLARAKAAAELKKSQEESYKKLLANYSIDHYLKGDRKWSPSHEEMLRTLGVKASDILSRKTASRDFKRGKTSESVKLALDDFIKGKSNFGQVGHITKLMYQAQRGIISKNPHEANFVDMLINPNNSDHKYVVERGGLRKIFKLSDKNYVTAYKKGFQDQAKDAGNVLLTGHFGWGTDGKQGFGEHLQISKNHFEQSSFFGNQAKPALGIYMANSVTPDTSIQTYEIDLEVLKNIDFQLGQNKHVLEKLRGNVTAQTTLRKMIDSIASKNLATTDGGTVSTFEASTLYGLFPNIAKGVQTPSNSEEAVGDIRERLLNRTPIASPPPAQSNLSTVPSQPNNLLVDGSNKFTRWREDTLQVSSNTNMVLVDALNLNYDNSYVKNQMGKNTKYNLNKLTFEQNKELKTLWNSVQTPPRGTTPMEVVVNLPNGGTQRKTVTPTQFYNNQMNKLLKFWEDHVSTPGQTTTDSLAELLRASAVAADWQAGHYTDIQSKYGRGVSGDVYAPRAWKLGNIPGQKAETTHIKEKRSLQENIVKMESLSEDVREILVYLRGNNTEKLDNFFRTADPQTRMLGPGRAIRSAITNIYEYGREIIGLGVKNDTRLADVLAQEGLDDTGNTRNKSIIEAQAERIRRKYAGIDLNSASKEFQMAAVVDFKKLALTYRLSGMVQGDTTGGRTISNQDFEVMLKALWGGSQQGTQARLQSLLQRIDKSIMQSHNTIFLKTRGTFDKVNAPGGFHDRLSKSISRYYSASLAEKLTEVNGHVSTDSLTLPSTSGMEVSLKEKTQVRSFRREYLDKLFATTAANSTDTFLAPDEDLRNKYNISEEADARAIVQGEYIEPSIALNLNDRESIREHLFHRTHYLPSRLTMLAHHVNQDPSKRAMDTFDKVYTRASEYVNSERGINDLVKMLKASGLTNSQINQNIDAYRIMYDRIFKSVYPSNRK